MDGVYSCHPEPLYWVKDPIGRVEKIMRFFAPLRMTNYSHTKLKKGIADLQFPFIFIQIDLRTKFRLRQGLTLRKA